MRCSPRSDAPCAWCGHAHPVQELCRARRVHRRTFLFTASAAAIGALLPGAAPGEIVETLWPIEGGGPFFRTHAGDVYTIILYHFAIVRLLP